MNRRKFIESSVIGALVTHSTVRLGRELESTQNSKKSRANIKLSCNMYSFNKLLVDGVMSLESAIDFCGDLGFDAVDPTGYYFTGYPDIPTDTHIYNIKKRAFDNGMAISGTGIRNDFAQESLQKRRKDIELTKKWVEVAAKLDAPLLRVFAGHPVGDDGLTREVQKRIIEAISECVEYSKSLGVTIVLQNHWDVLKSVEDVRSVLDAIPSEWFGLNLDIGSLRQTDPYREILALAPYAKTWQIKEHVYRNEVKEDVDPSAIARILYQTDYRGYIPLETLPPSDPRYRLEPFLGEIRNGLLG